MNPRCNEVGVRTGGDVAHTLRCNELDSTPRACRCGRAVRGPRRTFLDATSRTRSWSPKYFHRRILELDLFRDRHRPPSFFVDRGPAEVLVRE